MKAVERWCGSSSLNCCEYLKVSGLKVGLLMNFNCPILQAALQKNCVVSNLVSLLRAFVPSWSAPRIRQRLRRIWPVEIPVQAPPGSCSPSSDLTAGPPVPCRRSARELVVRLAQRGFGLDAQLARQVGDGEEQVAHLLFGARLVVGGAVRPPRAARRPPPGSCRGRRPARAQSKPTAAARRPIS